MRGGRPLVNRARSRVPGKPRAGEVSGDRQRGALRARATTVDGRPRPRTRPPTSSPNLTTTELRRAPRRRPPPRASRGTAHRLPPDRPAPCATPTRGRHVAAPATVRRVPFETTSAPRSTRRPSRTRRARPTTTGSLVWQLAGTRPLVSSPPRPRPADTPNESGVAGRSGGRVAGVPRQVDNTEVHQTLPDAGPSVAKGAKLLPWPPARRGSRRRHRPDPERRRPQHRREVHGDRTSVPPDASLGSAGTTRAEVGQYRQRRARAGREVPAKALVERLLHPEKRRPRAWNSCRGLRSVSGGRSAAPLAASSSWVSEHPSLL